MKTSVVIVAYNEAEDIADCIQSLLEQTLKPDEILLIDDGSTDKTVEIASQYPVTIHALERAGRCAARNAGWKKASGDIICFAEADSVFNKKWLEDIVRAFGAGADAVIDQRRPFYRKTFFQKCLLADFEIRFADYKPFSAWAFRREVLEKTGGYNESLDTSEERELGTRIKKKGYSILLAKKSFQYHKGEATSLWRYLKRAYQFEKKRKSGYLRLHPTEQAWLQIILLLVIVVAVAFSFSSVYYLLLLLGLIILAYIALFLKIGMLEKGFSLIDLPYLFGLAGMRLLRTLAVALGSAVGSIFPDKKTAR
ncbi:MAG: glycosyltransferase [Candidatus Kerfeldbacteria bacterium]